MGASAAYEEQLEPCVVFATWTLLIPNFQQNLP